jgi:hypothetical protein
MAKLNCFFLKWNFNQHLKTENKVASPSYKLDFTLKSNQVLKIGKQSCKSFP